jgi:uncharacterized protein with HEPN domain
MSRDQQRLQDYLAHILQAIERIDRYCEDFSELDFLQNELVQDAVIRNFEVVGQACNNIEKHYADFAEAHPELPLSSAYQMRNAIAHGYFKVDYELVWKTIQSDLPTLYELIQQAEQTLQSGQQ